MSPFAAILFLLVLLAAILIAATAIFGGMLGPSFNRFNPFLRRSNYAPDPTCGRCGYPSRGISSMICPECGADLREVGIKTPEIRQAMRGGNAAGCFLPFLWSIGIFIGIIVFGQVLSDFSLGTLRTEYSTDLLPNSAAYKNLGVLVQYAEPTPHSHRMGNYSNYWGSPSENLELAKSPRANTPNSLTIEIHPLPIAGTSVVPSRFEVDIDHRSFRFRKPSGSWEMRQGRPSDADFQDWFVANGLNTQNSQVAAEAAELPQLIDALDRKHRAFSLSQFTTYGSNEQYWIDDPSEWYQVAFFCFVFLLWLAGLIFFATRPPKQKSKNN